MALYNSVANLGGLVGPWMVGEVVHRTGSYDDALKFMGVSVHSRVHLCKNECCSNSPSFVQVVLSLPARLFLCSFLVTVSASHHAAEADCMTCFLSFCR